MGLTLYYEWKIKSDAQSARRTIAQWHALAKALPFDSVSDIDEYDSPDGSPVFNTDDEVTKLGGLYLSHLRSDGEEDLVYVPPLHSLVFYVHVNGSETGPIGLASHPPVVIHRLDAIKRSGDGNGEERTLNDGEPIEFPTHRRGYYSWHWGCKTQYAGNPSLGGEANFLKAHLSLIELFDRMHAAGVETEVRDDSGYAEHRDVEKLLQSLRDWNAVIARVAGKLSDALGGADGGCVAPIMDRPDFEHLEADGIRVLKEMAARQRKRKHDSSR